MSFRKSSIVSIASIIGFTLSARSYAQIQIPTSGIINSIAGNGVYGYEDSPSAANGEFSNRMQAIAIDGSGNSYIADSGNNRIRKINAATGALTTIAGNGTAGSTGDGGSALAAELLSPDAVAITSSGDVIIGDSGFRIRKISATDNTITTIAGTGKSGFSGDGGAATSAQITTVSSIAIDKYNNIFFVDNNNGRVREINAKTGIITTVAGSAAFGSSGDGGLATNAAIEPKYVAVDNNGNLYLSQANTSIREVTAATGIIQTIAGSGTQSASGIPAVQSKINRIAGITVDPFGNLYFADSVSELIRQINLQTGIISTVAGNGSPISSNGTCSEINNSPATSSGVCIDGGIGVDTSGNIYILDTADVRVTGGPSLTTGFVNPRYVILGVTYAPPGPNSYVQYSNSTLVSNTTSLTNSFSDQTSVSLSVSADISAWGTGGKITGTTSSAYTQGSTAGSSVTISQQLMNSTKTMGTPDAFSPVNHNYDIVWLWLNPLLVYSFNANSPAYLQSKGYGFDPTDQPVMDVWPVYVGYLNGAFGPLDQEDATKLARSWASNQIWPQGQGPAITSADYPTILGADPFTNANYVLTLANGSSPATTTDGRFTLSGNGSASSFDYVQAGPNNGGGITQQYTNTYTNSSQVSQGANYAYQQSFGIEEQFSATLFLVKLSYDLKESNTLNWQTQANQSFTTTNTQTDLLSITGPSCTGSPCNPAYSGPPQFDVYQDNLYGTFAFNPIY